jgi:hypothetical protein
MAQKPFNESPVAQSTVTTPVNVPGGSEGMPGGFLAISANGGQDGILWANHTWAERPPEGITEGVLRAFDPGSLRELWNSRKNRARDDFGNFAKFCPPTVANGCVYMATMGGLSHKVMILDERPLGGPAMINRAEVDLVLGWSGGEGHLNIVLSGDGVVWGEKVTIPNETTPNGLALAFNGSEPPDGRSFISWTGTDGDHSLNVMSTVDPTLRSWSNKHPVPGARSHHGPALLFANGRLFIAWTGSDDRLNVMSSGDLGASWQNIRTLTETSPDGPALAFWNGNLILMWFGTVSPQNLSYIQSSDGGLTWGNKVTIDERTGSHPAMAIGAGQTPYFCWAGLDNKQINLVHSENGSTDGFGASPNFKRTFDEIASEGPCLCEFQGKMFIGWTGPFLLVPSLSVAQLSRGSVAVYGHHRLHGQIDTSALTNTHFTIPGVTPGPVDGAHGALVSLKPGTYKFQQQNPSADFDFSVTLDGTFDYDRRNDAFLSGRGSETLIVRGFPIAVDSTSLSHALLPVSGAAALTPDRINHLVLLPAAGYSFFSASGVFADLTFAVEADGTVVVDPRLAGFAQASGQTLTIKGYRITLDTQALSHGLSPDGIVGWTGGDLPPGRHDITVVPIEMPSIGYQFASASGVIMDFTLMVIADGTVVVDPRFAGFVQVSGQTVTIKGYRITLDTQALSHGLSPDGIVGWTGGDLPPGRHDITVVPIEMPSIGYQFIFLDGTGRILNLTLDADGTITIKPSDTGVIATRPSLA